jgi:hypothetical protein
LTITKESFRRLEDWVAEKNCRMELKMTADNERIRREQRASPRSLSLQSRRSLYARSPAMESSFAIFRCRQGYQILCVWRRFARALVFWCFVLPVCLTFWLSVRRWSRASKTKRKA